MARNGPSLSGEPHAAETEGCGRVRRPWRSPVLAELKTVSAAETGLLVGTELVVLLS